MQEHTAIGKVCIWLGVALIALLLVSGAVFCYGWKINPAWGERCLARICTFRGELLRDTLLRDNPGATIPDTDLLRCSSLRPVPCVELCDMISPHAAVLHEFRSRAECQSSAFSICALNLSQSHGVRNLSAIHGYRFEYMNLSNTQFERLGLLQKMPLRWLSLSGIPATDFTPLATLQLEELDLSYTKISDLAPLRGMPLSSLSLRKTQVISLEPLRGMKLTSLSLSFTNISDLSALKGMPLTELILRGSKVTDLSALAGMPLKHLDIADTAVTDLSPLKGMPLERLIAYRAPLSDIAVLQGMPLRHLNLWATKVKDIPPHSGTSTGCHYPLTPKPTASTVSPTTETPALTMQVEIIP